MAFPEVAHVLTGVAVGGGLGYLVYAWRIRVWRANALFMVKSDSGGHVKPMTVADYEKASAKLATGMRDSILGNISNLRRELAEVNAHISSLEVVLRDAIGRAERDRAQARQEGLLTEDSRTRLHAEIQGLHKAIGVLAKAATEIQGSVGKVEEWVKKWA